MLVIVQYKARHKSIYYLLADSYDYSNIRMFGTFREYEMPPNNGIDPRDSAKK